MAQAGPASIGQTINSYLIIERLGSGGMGIVFKAMDTRLDRLVALKFLPEEVAVDERSRTIFLNEARAASALDHPNVGTIYGIEQTESGRMFIVMAFYDGQTLAQKISLRPIPPPEVIRIAAQIASGLGEAHAHNVIHRDMKPANVIVTPPGLIKILDFGLARVERSVSMTQSIGLSGTTLYMSPEQALGKVIDQRTDLWSLGVTIFEMLSARLPFEGEGQAATLMAIIHSPPKELDSQVPVGLQRIVYRLLIKDPAARYQTTSELLADLEEQSPARQSDVGRLRALAAKPATLPWVSTSRIPTWLGAISVILVLALAIAMFVPLVRERVLPSLSFASPKHIAVLPLETNGTSASDIALAEGLRQSLTDKLSNLEPGNQALWVVPASEIREKKITTPGQAFRVFGANLVVTGRLERNAHIRLVLNLIDAKNTRQLGSTDSENQEGNFSEVEDSAIAKLAGRMNLPNTRHDGNSSSVLPTAYEAYLQALSYIDRYDKPGNLDIAVKLLRAALRKDSKFTLAYASLAKVYLLRYGLSNDKHWLEQASSNCDLALHLTDQLPAVYVTFGRVQSERGKYDLALQEFQHALSLEPHNADALIGIASVYEREGRLADAEEKFKSWSALRPDYWASYNELGLFYLRQKKYSDALAQFQRAMEITPDNSFTYVNSASVFIATGKLDQAEAALKRAAELSPSYAVYANLGELHYRQRQFSDASRDTQEALKLNDKDWRVWINFANIKRWLKQDSEARNSYLRALPLMIAAAELKPEDSELQAALGLVYADLGNREKAIEHVRASKALGSDDPLVEALTGEAYDVLGDHPKAIGLVKEAIGRGLPIDDIKLDPEMQNVLASLQTRKLQ